jgi:hypothetical protein
MTVTGSSNTGTMPGRRICPNCGAALDRPTGECPACGQALCPRCQAAIAEDADKCPACGMQIELACPDCSSVLKPGDTRCLRCGAVFANPPPPPVSSKLAPLPSREQVIQEGYRYGVRQMQAGITGIALEVQLCAKGFDPATAGVMVRNLNAAHSAARRQQGRRELVSGMLATVGGGLMLALFSRLVLHRSAVTLLDIVIDGLIIVGSIQVVRGLRHYRQSRASVEMIPQTVSNVPLPDRAMLWPSRLQNHRLLAGLLVLPLACVLAYVLAIATGSQVKATLITRPASEINLQVSDLPASFQILEDARPQEVLDQNTSDVSRRVFMQADHGIIAVVTSGPQAVWGDLQETTPAMISQVFPYLRLGTMTDIDIGDQALLCDITLDTQDGVHAGYLLIFFKQNILVFLVEADRSGNLQAETVLSHARTIENRLR